MLEPVGDSVHADLRLDSSLESVDTAEQVVLEATRQLGFDEDSQHEVGIAVRETMVNAITHGNQYNSRKKVGLRVWKGAGSLRIEIEDEGKGFDANSVPDPREGDNVLRHSGRGLLMIKAYMDEFEIRPCKPHGTLVRMVKYQGPAAGPGKRPSRAVG